MSKPVAVITGANQGIGFHIAQQLGQLGYKCVLGCRRAHAGIEAEKDMRAAGVDAEYMALDISRPESVSAFANAIESKFGEVVCLVNNAAIAFKQADATPFEGLCIDVCLRRPICIHVCGYTAGKLSSRLHPCCDMPSAASLRFSTKKRCRTLGTVDRRQLLRHTGRHKQAPAGMPIHMSAHTSIQMSVHMSAHTSVHMSVHISARMSARMPLRMCTRMPRRHKQDRDGDVGMDYRCTYAQWGVRCTAHAHVCTHVYTRVYTHVYTHVYIHFYTHV